jgi:hypothetical protein
MQAVPVRDCEHQTQLELHTGIVGLSAAGCNADASSPIRGCEKNAILLVLDRGCQPVELQDSARNFFHSHFGFLLIFK